MDNREKELMELLLMTYDDAFEYLRRKNGIPKTSYRDKKGIKKNVKIMKEATAKGCQIHHYWGKYEVGMSAKEYYGVKEMQEPKYLCFATPLEHFILHLIIARDSDTTGDRFQAIVSMFSAVWLKWSDSNIDGLRWEYQKIINKELNKYWSIYTFLIDYSKYLMKKFKKGVNL